MLPPVQTTKSRPKQEGPGWFTELSKRVIAAMLRNKLRTILLFLALAAVFEVLEHYVIRRFGTTAEQALMIINFVVLIPFAAYLLLLLLSNYDAERKQATFDKDLQTELSQQLGDARCWEDLTRRIVEWPHRVSLLTSATLFVMDQHSRRLVAECSCDWEGLVTVKPPMPPEPDTLPRGEARGGPFTSGSMLAQPPGERHYNLPIFFNEQQIGMLKLEYPSASLPEPAEMRMLKSALPLIGLALEGALLQNLAAQQAEASQAERQQIAQHLHDTLAQNISYLRLKLDQLTGENAIREIGVVLQELERMRASADEAYQQVRNTLDELNPTAGEDVLAMIVRQAEVISGRAGFKLQAWQTGAPYPLPSTVRRQILYVAREALHNVEKHAFAAAVRLQIVWLENELIIKFTDDGIGFTPAGINDGHYGLWIMQQRAQEIGGTLKISPAEEHGTEVTLWVPRPDYRMNNSKANT